MKEGEPILGGPQANPGATDVPNPGMQPVSPIVSQNNIPASRPVIPSLTRRPQFAPQPQIQPQPISPVGGDIVLSNPNPKPKSKKTLIITLALVFIAIVVSVLFFVLHSTTFKEELDKEAINNFAMLYEETLTQYSQQIGFDTGAETQADQLWFDQLHSLATASDQTSNRLGLFLEEASRSFENLDQKSKQYIDPDNRIATTLNDIDSNFSIFDTFYNTFFVPTMSIYFKNTPATQDCQISNQMSDLIKSSDQNISNVAKLYQDAYCKVNQSVYDQDDIDIYSEPSIFSAANKALIGSLKSINADDTGFQYLKDILSDINADDVDEDEHYKGGDDK